IRCAQDNAALEGAALTKSRDSRPPKSRGAEVEKAIGRASLKEPRTESVPVRKTSKNYHNGYREKSVLYPYFAVTFGRQWNQICWLAGEGFHEIPIGRLDIHFSFAVRGTGVDSTTRSGVLEDAGDCPHTGSGRTVYIRGLL